MKVLHVIHGYPPYYMAGSEVYTYNLTRELSKHDEVFVFTRIENAFENQYSFYDEYNDGIDIRRINKPQRDYTLRDKYLDEKIDNAFAEFTDKVQPDIVHIGHLSHLSTNIVNIAKEEMGLPIVYTIHDFWLFCFRGQLIDTELNICQGPSDINCMKCARQLFKENVKEEDIHEYRDHMKRVVNNIDLFLSPSQFLKKFFEDNGVPSNKVRYSKYGFNKDQIKFRDRTYDRNSKIDFGYTGRIIPVKGIKILLEAFSELRIERVNLNIFGNPGNYGKYLEDYTNKNISLKGGYQNWEINDVLDQIDVLIVPSLWYENSPLVIQEAFLAGIPVITSNIGGMAELVEDGVDGFTFNLGNKSALKELMGKIVDDPRILNSLKPARDRVRSIQDDASGVHFIYEEVLKA